ncbi:MAG: hypothetical protein H6831_04355 [Planctomycetes bacterium]|nr:hypothetical protein [Planctomycetota bacterium]
MTAEARTNPTDSAPEFWTRRRGLALLVAILLAYFAPVVFLGHVIYPHDNAVESGASREPGHVESEYRSTHRLDDQSTAYIPELAHALADDHESWIATWNPHNQLGRPLMQHFATGRAWIVGNAVSMFTRDPFRFYSWMALLAVSGAALAAYGFLTERALHPLAALVGALSLSVGPFAVGWQTLPMLPWDFCWVFGVLWGIERYLRRPSVWNRGAIVFAVHSLLLSGYPQHTMMLGWSIAGFVLWRVWKEREGLAVRAGAVAALAGLAVVGFVASLPVLADLYTELSRSVRADVTDELALAAVTKVMEPRDLWLSLLRSYDIFVGGHPYSPDFSRWLGIFRGYLFSPFYVGLLFLAPLVVKQRRDAPWWMACFLLAMVANHSAAFYQLGVDWLGLSFSDLPPIAGALLPAAVLSALVTDALLRGALPKWSPFLAAVPAVLCLVWVQQLGVELDRFYMGLAAAAGIGACVFAYKPRCWTLLPFALLVVFHHGRSLLVTRPRAEISTDSALVRDLRDRLADGSRFAWIGPRKGFLLNPNQEMLFGLASIHSYYSLQDRGFAHWAAKLGGNLEAGYNRRFLNVAGTAIVAQGELVDANVTHYLSTVPLGKAMGVEVARFGPVRVTEAERSGNGATLLPQGEFFYDSSVGYQFEPGLLRDRSKSIALDRGRTDQLVAESCEPGLLIVSAAYHPNWRAVVDGRPSEVIAIGESLFGSPALALLGVRVERGPARVEFRYEPAVRYAWIPQLAFVLFGAAAVFSCLRRRASSPG